MEHTLKLLPNRCKKCRKTPAYDEKSTFKCACRTVSYALDGYDICGRSIAAWDSDNPLDEVTLSKCACGGEARIIPSAPCYEKHLTVQCNNCPSQLALTTDATALTTAWNIIQSIAHDNKPPATHALG